MLAVHWAHGVADRFPGGQLYVDLGGYAPGPPLAPTDVLADFLRDLGARPEQVPGGVQRRAARFRSALAHRAVLVVLDNARSVEQVRWLLPGGGPAAVLVTSRDSLAALVARYGARRLDVGPLPPSDALTLLRRLVGARVEEEPGPAAALVERCARLPLALRLAAELTAGRPDRSLAELTEDLGDERRRLDLLDAGGDRRTALDAVFSWSYRRLPAEAARTFRLLGRHAGAEADVATVAALTDRSPADARLSLDTLAAAHLVEPTGPGRFGAHELLRAYARSLADREDPPADATGPGRARILSG